MTDIAAMLGAGGPLARSLVDFQPRDEQVRMAEAVGQALADGGTLVVEAGTGTGKTFAYLVPALLSGLRVVVSTGTRNLQDQLFSKDLPLVRGALDLPVSVALLKGRSNYLCLQRMEQARHGGRFDTREGAEELAAIEAWSHATTSGDVAEVTGVPEDSSIWPWVTSTTENCLGNKCPRYDECHVLKARRKALEADVVVINHHLLFADMMLRETGFGELLPGADAVILDEAHQLAETASNFFGTVVTGRTLADLARDATAAFVNDASDVPELKTAAESLETAQKNLRLALHSRGSQIRSHDNSRYRGSDPMVANSGGHSGKIRGHRAAPTELVNSANTRLAWSRWPAIAVVEERLDDVGATLARLAAVLEPLAERAPALEQCLERVRTTQDAIARLTDSRPEGRSHGAEDDPHGRSHESELPSWERRYAPRTGAVPGPPEGSSDGAGDVRWIETFGHGFALHRTPLDVSQPLSRLFATPGRAWVFTSATLAVGGDFGHFTGALGLGAPETLRLGSPFDYEHNALLYVPEELPEPNSPGFTRAVLDAALPVIAAAGGRTFMLFTSHRALREAADELEGRFAFPLLVQGAAPRDALLREFRELGNAVLLGTGSFWEGVDVRGDALSVVVIDKLPFAAPDDPVLAARIDAINAAGGSAFMEHQLPRAVIALKQGVGRLIRDATDTGVMMICDTRLATKGYRHAFLKSLPPMRRTRDKDDVLNFVRNRL